MGTWGTAIKNSDAFADIYSEYFDLYNKGGQPKVAIETWDDRHHFDIHTGA